LLVCGCVPVYLNLDLIVYFCVPVGNSLHVYGNMCASMCISVLCVSV
jgi:F0F1-type ATP synthase membrane subunit a